MPTNFHSFDKKWLIWAYLVILGPKQSCPYLSLTRSGVFTFGWKLDVFELQFIDFKKKLIVSREVMSHQLLE